jgi:uncharacterized membrane protein
MSETPHVPPPGGSFTPPPPPPPAGGATGGSRDTAMLVLSYLWFLSIIPLVAKKEDREVQWHAKNGLVFAIAYTAIEVIFFIIGHFFPLVGCLVSWIPCLIACGYLVVMILGIVKATSGQRFRLPMLSEYADKM